MYKKSNQCENVRFESKKRDERKTIYVPTYF